MVWAAAARWAGLVPYLVLSSAERDPGHLRSVRHHYNISQCLPAAERAAAVGGSGWISKVKPASTAQLHPTEYHFDSVLMFAVHQLKTLFTR